MNLIIIVGVTCSGNFTAAVHPTLLVTVPFWPVMPQILQPLLNPGFSLLVRTFKKMFWSGLGFMGAFGPAGEPTDPDGVGKIPFGMPPPLT